MRNPWISSLLLLLALTAWGPARAQVPDARAWLTLEDTAWRQTGNDVVVTGIVVSHAPRAVWNVDIAFTGYDRENYPIMNGGTRLYYMAPGDRVPFQATAGALNRVYRVDLSIASVDGQDY